MKDTEADKPAEVEKGTVAKKDVVVEKPAANAAKEASAKQLPTTGFEVPQRGAVCYGGRDLARLDARALRRNIGVVLQGEKLFGGSIYDNIAIFGAAHSAHRVAGALCSSAAGSVISCAISALTLPLFSMEGAWSLMNL